MNFLEERIVKDGIVKEGNVLKVDSFLNHQQDPDNRSFWYWDCLYCSQAFSCAGCICKKDTEHQSGRGDVCSRSRIIYPQMQEPGNCSKEISFRGRSCAHY